MFNIYSIIRQSINTSKTLQLKRYNKLCFGVRLSANKKQIKNIIKKVLSISITAINTMITHRKSKRVKNLYGRRSKRKKAILSVDKKVDVQTISLGPSI